MHQLVKTGIAGSPMRNLVKSGKVVNDFRDKGGNTVLLTAMMLQKPEDTIVPIVQELLHTKVTLTVT